MAQIAYARYFDGNDDTISCSVDAFKTAPNHAIWAFIVKLEQQSGFPTIGSIDGGSGGEIVWFAQETGLDVVSFGWYGGNNSPVFSDSAYNTWYLLVITKENGSSTPRGHLYNYTSATWSHGNFNLSEPEPTAPAGAATLRFGSYQGNQEFFQGWMAMQGIGFDLGAVPDDSAIEAANLEDALDNWLSSGFFDGAWRFDQDSETEALEDLIGSCDQTARTGTQAQSISDLAFDVGGTTAGDVVQTKTATSDGSATSIAVTFDDPVTEGNFISVHVSWDYGGGIGDLVETVTDDLGSKYQYVDTASNNVFNQRSDLWFTKAVDSSGSCTITVTFTDSVPFRRVIAVERSGMSGYNLEQWKDEDEEAVSTGTDALTVGPIIPSGNDQVIIAILDVNGAAPTIAPGTGFSEDVEYTDGSGQVMQQQHLLQGTAAIVSGTWTAGTGAGGYAAIVASFRAPRDGIDVDVLRVTEAGNFNFSAPSTPIETSLWQDVSPGATIVLVVAFEATSAEVISSVTGHDLDWIVHEQGPDDETPKTAIISAYAPDGVVADGSIIAINVSGGNPPIGGIIGTSFFGIDPVDPLLSNGGSEGNSEATVWSAPAVNADAGTLVVGATYSRGSGNTVEIPSQNWIDRMGASDRSFLESLGGNQQGCFTFVYGFIEESGSYTPGGSWDDAQTGAEQARSTVVFRALQESGLIGAPWIGF